MRQKTALVLGAGGFIGSHISKRLKKEGYWVRGADLKYPEFSKTACDHFIIGDLRIYKCCNEAFELPIGETFDLVIQMAADMGGATYIFSGENDANVMHNSVLINAHIALAAAETGAKKLLYTSSACVYPMEAQENPDNKGLKESDAYPIHPDSEYGYEKIFSERLYDAFRRNYGLDIRVVRFHNVFGEEGTWDNNKAKAPASLCKKVAMAKDGDSIEVLGDGLQTRSFLYIDEAIEGCMRVLESDYYSPINVGSDEIISINHFAKMIIEISGKSLSIKNIETSVQGVRGRNSDNSLIFEKTGWKPSKKLRIGMEKLYNWINQQVNGR